MADRRSFLSGLTALLPAAALTLTVALGGLVTALSPRDGRPVAIVVPPGQSAAAAFRAAGETGIGLTDSAAGGRILFTSATGEQAPALRAAGAVLVVDAAFARSCL